LFGPQSAQRRREVRKEEAKEVREVREERFML